MSGDLLTLKDAEMCPKSKFSDNNRKKFFKKKTLPPSSHCFFSSGSCSTREWDKSNNGWTSWELTKTSTILLFFIYIYTAIKLHSFDRVEENNAMKTPCNTSRPGDNLPRVKQLNITLVPNVDNEDPFGVVAAPDSLRMCHFNLWFQPQWALSQSHWNGAKDSRQMWRCLWHRYVGWRVVKTSGLLQV